MKIKKIGEIEKIGNGGKFNAMYQEKMNQIQNLRFWFKIWFN